MADQVQTSEESDWVDAPLIAPGDGDTWSTCPIVFMAPLVCPRCQSPRPLWVKGKRESDGSRSRRYVCSGCSKKFLVVIESTLPEIGRDGAAMGRIES